MTDDPMVAKLRTIGWPLLVDAADEIERLRAENARLRSVFDEIRKAQQEYVERAAENDDDYSVAGAVDEGSAYALRWVLGLFETRTEQ